MKVGICIPCHYGHIGYLDCVLASMERQTVLPHIVSISISEYPQEKEPLNTNSYSFKLLITTTQEQKNAAENRNIAAQKIINDVDILSFFDADDYSAPKRVQVIKNTFEKNDMDIFLHSYFHWTPDFQKKHVNEIIPLLNQENSNVTTKFNIYVNPYLQFGQIIPDISCPITYGNVSIKSELFKKIQFPEDDILFSCGEDSHFNYLHYKSGAKVLASSAELTMYSTQPNKMNSEVEKAILNHLKNKA
jgi:hypothetical protein